MPPVPVLDYETPPPKRTVRDAAWEFVAWCREHIADYKRPRIVEFVDELPRDPNGKVRKPKWREAWIAQQEAAT